MIQNFVHFYMKILIGVEWDSPRISIGFELHKNRHQNFEFFSGWFEIEIPIKFYTHQKVSFRRNVRIFQSIFQFVKCTDKKFKVTFKVLNLKLKFSHFHTKERKKYFFSYIFTRNFSIFFLSVFLLIRFN